MLVGSTGFIGSAICARLIADGHQLIGVSRASSSTGLLEYTQITLDVAKADHIEVWRPFLKGVDAVVNCAGILQDSPGESVRGVHARGIASLFDACAAEGVRRVVHFSAIGVDRETPSVFSQTKQEGDALLMAHDLDWVILRPSVVIGRAAYGGSALLRGLAALPVLPVMPDTGPLQFVHLDDVVETVAFFMRPDAPTRKILELAGPRQWSFSEAVQLFRRWMRWPRAREIAIPAWLAAAIYWLGDVAGLLGWRPPVRSTARLEMRRGAVGDPSAWQAIVGIKARDLEEALRCDPASVQDRWFARLYLLKPVVLGSFGLFWIATGLISLGPGWNEGMALLRESGASGTIALAAIVSGGLADIGIGMAILYRRTSCYGLYAALAITMAYTIIGTFLVPHLWSHPLGPMLKIWPIIIFNLVAIAIREDR
jgi:uncharacterized protein YbjT (DUF2867 family)